MSVKPNACGFACVEVILAIEASRARHRHLARTIRSRKVASVAMMLVATLVPYRIAMGQENGAEHNVRIGSGNSTAPAADDFDDIDLLDLKIPMVVTATRRAQPLTTVPNAMSVITADDIRQSGARTVYDALRLVPGVDVSELSSGAAAVSVRGFHGFLSRAVLVLVDGRQIFDSLFGGTLWGNWPFQIDDIARIEVLRGPGGVTWGGNAVNGVINIITKEPDGHEDAELILRGGSRGSFSQHLSAGYLEGNLRLRISAGYDADDGFRKGGSFLRSLDDEYQGGRMSIYGVYEKNPDDRLAFSAGHASINGALPPTPLAGIGLRRNSASQASYVKGTWSRRLDQKRSFELTGYVNDFWASPGVPAIDYRYQQIALQFGYTFIESKKHTRTWGVDSRVDILDSSNSDPFLLTRGFLSAVTLGVYVRDQWNLAPKWNLDAGVRLDYESYTGFEPSARAAISYELDDESMVYASVSRAVAIPSVGLRFLNIPMFNRLARVTSDENMDTESLIAYELGYRGKLRDRLDASVNLFWHEFDDLTVLSSGLGPPGLFRMDLDNDAQASLYGFEADLKFAATKRTTFLANYTYQQLDWSSPTPLRNKDVMTAPKHKAMIGVRYRPRDDVRLSGHAYFVDAVEAPNPANPFAARRVDPYIRLDLRAEKEFDAGKTTLAIGVRNLLDRNHYEGGTLFLNDAQVPRTFYAELRIAIR